MAMQKDKQFQLPLDYVDVAARVREFRAKFPEGTLQQQSLDFREVAGQWWVIYTAAAYRTPDDPRPAHGTAWEKVPGTTPYTRDSELQNAETAAWGRAIIAVGAADAKKIASTEEVRNRQLDETPPVPADFEKQVADAPNEEALKGLWTEAVNAGFAQQVIQLVGKRKKELLAE